MVDNIRNANAHKMYSYTLNCVREDHSMREEVIPPEPLSKNKLFSSKVRMDGRTLEFIKFLLPLLLILKGLILYDVEVYNKSKLICAPFVIDFDD